MPEYTQEEEYIRQDIRMAVYYAAVQIYAVSTNDIEDSVEKAFLLLEKVAERY